MLSWRSAVLVAQSRVDLARILVNRLRHRPLEEPFSIVAPTLAQPDMVSGFGRLRPYIENGRSLRLFREFSVGEGLGNTPELRSIDAAIQAGDVVSQGGRVHGNFGMGVGPEQLRAFHTDGAIAKRGALG